MATLKKRTEILTAHRLANILSQQFSLDSQVGRLLIKKFNRRATVLDASSITKNDKFRDSNRCRYSKF